LKLGDPSKRRRKNVQDIFDMAHKTMEEDSPEQIMIIIPHRERPPEMMMAGLSEIELLGTLEFIKGLVMTAQTAAIPEEDDAPTPEED
jgi:hypothetical protein